jgi:hypothetical protein
MLIYEDAETRDKAANTEMNGKKYYSIFCLEMRKI